MTMVTLGCGDDDGSSDSLTPVADGDYAIQGPVCHDTYAAPDYPIPDEQTPPAAALFHPGSPNIVLFCMYSDLTCVVFKVFC